MRTKSASRHAARRRLLSQGKVVGELAGHIGDTAALPRELLNDHARFVEVARARHAVGPLKLKPIRQSAVHKKAPQRQRRLFANRAAREIAQAAARQRQSGAIVLPEGKPIIFLSSEEAARDRLTGASTAIVAFAFAVAFRRPASVVASARRASSESANRSEASAW